MTNLLIVFRIILVLSSAIFMAFHTQIFISRIEPNLIFSWIISFVIEGFLISLALSSNTLSKILLVPVFIISVVSASLSFTVKNEDLLNAFFTNKRVIEQLKADITETKKAYDFGQKYTTKTLQRERQLSDELREILKTQAADIAIVNSIVFFILVLVIQAVSVFTAASLKQYFIATNSTKAEAIVLTKKEQSVSVDVLAENKADTLSEIEQNKTVALFETKDLKTEQSKTVAFNEKEFLKQRILELQAMGDSYSKIAQKLNISKSKISRILNDGKK